jgi:hypothetical protein
MTRIIARVFAYLSPAWIALHLFWILGGYRDQVMDEFLRNPALDSGLGALMAIMRTFTPSLVAVGACLVLEKQEDRQRPRPLTIGSIVTLLVGLLLYFGLPSLHSTMEQILLEQLQNAAP